MVDAGGVARAADRGRHRDRAASRVVATRDEAVGAAAAITYPVVVEGTRPDTAAQDRTPRRLPERRTRTGSARRRYADFTARFGPEMTAVLVQAMVPPGIEMMVGAVQDPLFGPLIALRHRAACWWTCWRTRPSACIR